MICRGGSHGVLKKSGQDLEVEDISEKAGDYTAHLTIRTDNPKKPRLTLTVRGEIKEK